MRPLICCAFVMLALVGCGGEEEPARPDSTPTPTPYGSAALFTLDLPEPWTVPQRRFARAFRRVYRKKTGANAELRAVRGPNPTDPRIALFVTIGPPRRKQPRRGLR